MGNGDDTGQYIQYGRRGTDNSEMIEELIRAENDPKTRSVLVIMNAINNSLIDLSKSNQRNVESNQRVEAKLITHLESYDKRTKAEEALFNQGKGLWKAASLTLLLIQALCFYIWSDTQAVQKEHSQQIVKMIATDAVADKRLTVIEDRLKLKVQEYGE
jgi:hypothetical protein